jgi:thiol-disulfide isomerase/thioredoxin
LIVLTTFSVTIPFAPVLAQDAPERKKKNNAVPSLKMGDPAPALKATKWFLGEPVSKFEPGKVYVVHFWATWCPPCIGKMPDLADLQARYKDKGVTVISFTCLGIQGRPGNTEEAVAAFVKKRAKALKLNYPLAYADDSTAADAWLTAAGQDGWATFLVDKDGRIAYAGSHWFLEVGLPKLLAGTDAKTVGDEMAKAAAEYEGVMDALVRDFQAGHDLKADLKALKDFELRYPPLSDLLTIVQAKLSLLPKYGGPGEAKAYAEAIVTKGIQREDVWLLGLACSILRNEKESKESLALALRAAKAVVRIDGGVDAQSLVNLADAYLINGDAAQAKLYARRAIEAAAGETSDFRQEIEKEARRLGVEN